jgi:hypothetical protein
MDYHSITLHWAFRPVRAVVPLDRPRDGGTNASLAEYPGGPTVRAMKKRVVSAFLWFYVGWTFGSLIAFAFGISPVLGAAASALFVGDPRRIIWSRPATPSNLHPEGA